ncbi:glycoside hydrolase superfamily [Flagelloscypha sp. PMI_526]|nr:glycoside hydrolase superfamily [Flagelloscypha sp. PMI_526]
MSTHTPPLAGINIAGFDFGTKTDGSVDSSQIKPPTDGSGPLNGYGQIWHFVNDDHLNAFRIPVSWQYLVSSPGGTLNSNAMAKYDGLLQNCISLAQLCILDVYARWNGAIIGQGGPSNDQFVNLWSQLAAKYKGQSKVAFGVMNEPHDIPNFSAWVTTVQAVVTAIRQAGATSQIILLPGNNWTSAETFVSGGSGPALLAVKNPDGSTNNLVFDVHKYLDSDNSGTHTECVKNNIDNAFAPLASWLRSNGRKAFVSETGGGNTNSCITYFCQQLSYLNSNSDVYLGYTTWSAGSFDASWNYELTEVPFLNNNIWTDTSLVQSCIRR